MSDDNPFADKPSDLSRQDELVRGDNFRTWLWRVAADAANPYYRLREVIGRSGAPFGGSYEEARFAAHLERLAPDEPELVEQLIEAAAEWQIEALANAHARAELGVPEPKARTLLIPPTTCGFVAMSGASCRHPVVPGSVRCVEHGGALIAPEVRRAMLISAYCSIVSHTQIAVDALAQVAQFGRNELARVQAAKEILDRAGLSPELHVAIRVDVADETDRRGEAVDRLRTRLDGMQRGLMARVVDTSAAEADPTEDFPVDGNGNGNNGNKSL